MFKRRRDRADAPAPAATPRPAPAPAPVPWTEPALVAVPGYRALAEQYAGRTAAGGLLRVHGADDGPAFQALVDEMFPEHRGRAVAFARDWLGRAFAVDLGRVVGGEPQLLLMEPATATVFEVDAPVSAFLDEVGRDPETYLAADLYAEWAAAGGAAPGPTECVGLVVPLFLGGRDDVSNLEVTDVDVYWSLTAQLRAATRDLPPGTSVTRATIE